VIEKLKAWLRWRVACALDHFPDTCWTELVLWALNDDRPLAEAFELRHSVKRCTKLRGQPLFCGKCAENDGK